MDIILAITAILLGVFGAIPTIILARNHRLSKRYSKFFVEIFAEFFVSAEIFTSDSPEDIRRKVKNIVEKLSNKYFGKSRPPLLNDPIRKAIFAKPFRHELICSLCNAEHQPDERGSCLHCGLPCPFWCMPAFKTLKVQHQVNQTEHDNS